MHTAYTIVTNNSRISPAFDPRFAVTTVSGGLEEIYGTLNELLQNGYSLVSSPLPANVPLIRSQVRSVIVRKNTARFDPQGLITLEKAKERTSVLGVTKDARVRGDLEMIDSDHLTRAIAQLKELGSL